MSDSDRELLEWAAKAAGFGSKGQFCWNEPTYVGDRLHCHGGLWDYVGGSPLWNPLHDDGDALRLAVRLGLIIEINAHRLEPFTRVFGIDAPPERPEEEHRSDPYRATRRAIVRAAAEIGRRA